MQESTAGRGGKAWTLRRRSRSLGDLTVEVEQPRDPASHAWFGFRARGGLREQDLRPVAATMHSALQMGRRGETDVSAGRLAYAEACMYVDACGCGGS